MIKMEDWLIQSFGFSHSSKVSCQKGAVGDNSYTWWDFLLLFRHSTGPSLQMFLGTDLAGTPVPCVSWDVCIHDYFLGILFLIQIMS